MECAPTDIVPPATESRTPGRWSSGFAIVRYIAAAMFLVEISVASRYGYLADELYFLGCSRHLAWGYIDQPPLIAAIAYVVLHTLGSSLLALRLLPAISAATLVCLIGAIVREMGGGRFAQALGALAVAVSPVYLYLHQWLLILAFESTLWAACIYFVVKAIQRNAPQDWLWAGLLAGFGLELKYTFAVFLAALFVGLLCTPRRNVLRTWHPWGGALIALIMFLPNLVWQYVHNFPFLEWQNFIRTHPGIQTFDFSLLTFLQHQLSLTLPMLLIWVAGPAYFLFFQEGKKFRFLGIAFLIVFVLASRSGKPHYGLAMYAIACTGGSILLEQLTDRANRRWLRRPFVLAMVALGALMAPCFIPLLPIDRVGDYQRALHLSLLGLPFYAEPYEAQHEYIGGFGGEFGYDEIVEAVAKVYQHLSPGDKAKAGIFTSSYGEAGAVDILGKKYGLPDAACGQLSYHDFGSHGYTGEVLIVVGPRHLERFCKVVEPGPYIYNPYGFDGQQGPIVNLCRTRANFTDLWPGLKHY